VPAWLSAGADIVAVAARLGDTVEHRARDLRVPGAWPCWSRGKGADQFVRRVGDEGSAPDVPPVGAVW